MNLANKTCIPCQGGVPALALEEKKSYLAKIDRDWNFWQSDTRLRRVIKTKDFVTSLRLANTLGELADEQWHHPTLIVGFGELVIEIWTHKINDLVESDFIFAAKADEIIKVFK